MNDIISSVLMEIAYEFISSSEPFTLAIDNHNNWDKPLPTRLSKLDKFVLHMEETDLEESYIADNGDLIITAGIDDEVYTKVLHSSDIHAISYLGKPPLIVKQFIEKPITAPTSPIMPSKEELQHSMDTFKKYNPSLFKLGVTVDNYSHN